MNTKDLEEIFSHLNAERDMQRHYEFLTGALYAASEDIMNNHDMVSATLLRSIGDMILPSDCYPIIKYWAEQMNLPWNEDYDRFHSMEHDPVPCEADYPSLLEH